ncbi:MAG: hypothetical protein ACYTG5_22365, partial [Planctomycetota bacterium]
MKITASLMTGLCLAAFASAPVAQENARLARLKTENPDKVKKAKKASSAEAAALSQKIKKVMAALPEDLRESIKTGEKINADMLDESELKMLKKVKMLKKDYERQVQYDGIHASLTALKADMPASIQKRYKAKKSGDPAAFEGLSEKESAYLGKMKKLQSAKKELSSPSKKKASKQKYPWTMVEKSKAKKSKAKKAKTKKVKG